MDPDEQALLATIAARPADDLPRLVYADWLDERGQATRAEFLRLQVAIAVLQTGPRAALDAHIPLFKRQQDLLDGNLAELLGPLAAALPAGADPARALRPVFERGLLAHVQVDWATLEAVGAALASLPPEPRVGLTSRHGHYPGWLDSPAAALVTELRLSDDLNAAGPASGDSGEFELVLDLFDPAELLADRESEVVRAWRQFRRLTTLNLAGNGVGDAGAANLPWAEFPDLVDLDLSNNNLTDAGVVALINAGVPQRLKRLILGGNDLTDQTAMELSDRVGANAGLRELNMRHTRLSNAGQGALLARFPGRVALF